MTLTQITRMPTGCPGLDHVLAGGLPEGRSTLVSGTAGSGKTVLGLQFLHDGARDFDQAGVFLTFEERPAQLRLNAASLGFDIATMEEQGKWTFVDASYNPDRDEQQVGPFDFGALLLRLRHAVESTGAKRVTLDSIGAVFTRYQDATTVRRELMRVTELLRELGVTAIVTSERAEEYGQIGRHGVEEFVCDNVMVLRNALEQETRRRTIEVLKMRGVYHLTGEFPFTIVPRSGIVVITLENTALNAPSADERIHSGLAELDEMCNGGMFRDSINLVSGATGTGKTLLVSEFTRGGASRGERSLIFSFEESRSQLFRNAGGWGMDFAGLEAQGLLRIEAAYPEISSLEDHLVRIKTIVEEYKPHRIAIDSLSALERIAPERSYREFLIGLTAYIKHCQVAALLTSSARNLLGATSVTDAHISTLTDMIMLLRYVEIGGAVRRGFMVLKLRGSTHDKQIHEFVIGSNGMKIGAPFRDVTGILAGSPQRVAALSEEYHDMSYMFDGD